MYGLASDHSSSISVVSYWPDVIPSMLQCSPVRATSVHILVLCQLSAPVKTVPGISYSDSSRDANTQVCIRYWWPSRRISLLAIRVDTGTFAYVLFFCSVLHIWFSLNMHCYIMCVLCVLYNAFSALTLLVGQQEGHLACKKTEWWGASMVICLGQCAYLHMAQLIPLPLTVSCSSKSRLVLPFWYWLPRLVMDKMAVKRVLLARCSLSV